MMYPAISVELVCNRVTTPCWIWCSLITFVHVVGNPRVPDNIWQHDGAAADCSAVQRGIRQHGGHVSTSVSEDGEESVSFPQAGPAGPDLTAEGRHRRGACAALVQDVQFAVHVMAGWSFEHYLCVCWGLKTAKGFVLCSGVVRYLRYLDKYRKYHCIDTCIEEILIYHVSRYCKYRDNTSFDTI